MVLMNCGSDDNNVPNNNNETTTFEPQNIETEVMLKGFSKYKPLYPTTDNYLIMNSQDELDDIISRISYKYKEHEYLQNFDFDNYQLIVVFNLMASIEKSIDITAVIEYENEIKVVVENLEANYENLMLFIGILLPVEIVKMPKMDKPVVFDTSLLLTF